MAKRRRGGGEEGEMDVVDVQLRDRDAAEDLAFLKYATQYLPPSSQPARVLPPAFRFSVLRPSALG